MEHNGFYIPVIPCGRRVMCWKLEFIGHVFFTYIHHLMYISQCAPPSHSLVFISTLTTWFWPTGEEGVKDPKSHALMLYLISLSKGCNPRSCYPKFIQFSISTCSNGQNIWQKVTFSLFLHTWRHKIRCHIIWNNSCGFDVYCGKIPFIIIQPCSHSITVGGSRSVTIPPPVNKETGGGCIVSRQNVFLWVFILSLDLRF